MLSTAARDSRGFAATAAAVAFLLLSGCSWGTPSAARPPRPDRLLVAPFAVVPGEIAADRLAGERGERLKGAAARTPEQERVGRYFAGVLQADLVGELRSLGLPAQAGVAPARAAGRLAWIGGELLSVAAGQPEVVGVEAGRPDVVAAAGLYAAGVSGPLQQVELALGGAAGSVPAGLLPPRSWRRAAGPESLDRTSARASTRGRGSRRPCSPGASPRASGCSAGCRAG